VAVLGSLNNRLIPAGLDETPAFAIPAQFNAIQLTMTRDNWPAAGCDIGIAVSPDGGQTWEWFRQHIAPFVPTAKNPNVADAPAKLGYAWNPDNPNVAKPTHIKAQTDSPDSFRTDITIEVGTYG